MEAYQERVIAERDELAEKITKLEDFLERQIFHPVPLTYAESLRLRRQSAYMMLYINVLNERIEDFPK